MIDTSGKDSGFSNAEESQIINALQSGEERMFESVYGMYSAALFYFCKSIVDHDQVAQDIVTESFVRTWEHKEHIGSLNDLRGFLYTTAKNFCLNHLRNSRRRSKHHNQFLNTLETVENSVLGLIVNTERRRMLYQAITLLPPQRQYIIKQMLENGKTVKELAAELDIDISAIYTAKGKALETLKRILENGGTLTVILALHILLIIIGLVKKLISS